MRHCVSRREFVGRLTAGVLGLQAPIALGGQLTRRPEISNLDLSLLHDWVTPNQFFFIREHFPTPKIGDGEYIVSVGGAVEAPYEISLSELTAQPERDLAVTLECAENPVGGGLVSHAEWTGVSLANVLEKAGLRPDGKFVRLTGEDGFMRSIPLEKARHPDVLLAYRMNREKLPVMHGGPLRALNSGWYGMDSVKWLRKVEVVADGENDSYLRRTRAGKSEPITKMNVKAAFARPVDGAVIFRRSFLARGVAWAGASRVKAVEFSSDGGNSWRTARLLDKAQPYAWVRWEFAWKIVSAGDYTLVIRAADDAGNSQPANLDPARVDNYEQNSYQRVRVTVA